MQISVSSTLILYHDGQFWVGLAERVEDSIKSLNSVSEILTQVSPDDGALGDAEAGRCPSATLV